MNKDAGETSPFSHQHYFVLIVRSVPCSQYGPTGTLTSGLSTSLYLHCQLVGPLLLDAPVLSACLPSGPAGVADFAVMLVGATGRFTMVFICCLLAVEPIGNISSLVSGYICMSV